LARPGDGLRAPVAERLLLEEDQRRQQRPEALDAQVTRALRHRAQMYTRAADVSMASVPVRVRARRRRGRRDTLPDAVDRLAVLERIQKKVLWLGTYMVHHANSLRASSDGIKVGGHQASSSSVVSLLTALYFDALRGDDLVAVKAHSSPAFYAIQYLRGRLTAEALRELRSFGGLQAYPSHRKNAAIVDLSTGSMGLGAVQATFGALASRYVADHFASPSRGRVVVMVGDAELDEGNVGEALAEEALARLTNVLWIVDVNRQSLDRIVPDGRVRATRRRSTDGDLGPHDQGLGAADRRRSAQPHAAPHAGPDRRAAPVARDRRGRGVGRLPAGERRSRAHAPAARALHASGAPGERRGPDAARRGLSAGVL